MTHVCWVCNEEVGDAHQCAGCKRNVHIFCGEPLEEEEGYGQKIICSFCLRLGGTKPLVSAPHFIINLLILNKNSNTEFKIC